MFLLTTYIRYTRQRYFLLTEDILFSYYESVVVTIRYKIYGNYIYLQKHNIKGYVPIPNYVLRERLESISTRLTRFSMHRIEEFH